jgi:2-polyprenyl-6-methoxyphenol hydroxylase-like FAD-dependent oxidoreductase
VLKDELFYADIPLPIQPSIELALRPAYHGDYALAFERYESLMRDFVKKCQRIADGGTDWFVPRTRFRHWFSNQMWKVLPYTPWKNLMIDVPLKIGNSISLKDY